MRKTRNQLMTLYCVLLTIAATLYICGEFLQLDMVCFYNLSRGVKFVLPTLMILLTLALVPLALRLFKLRRVHQDLIERKEQALAHWGRLRLFVLGGLLVVNTFLYYAFGYEPTYGYLAVVVLLTMPFVLPTLNRCMSEVDDDEVNSEPQPADADEHYAETFNEPTGKDEA